MPRQQSREVTSSKGAISECKCRHCRVESIFLARDRWPASEGAWRQQRGSEVVIEATTYLTTLFTVVDALTFGGLADTTCLRELDRARAFQWTGRTALHRRVAGIPVVLGAGSLQRLPTCRGARLGLLCGGRRRALRLAAPFDPF